MLVQRWEANQRAAAPETVSYLCGTQVGATWAPADKPAWGQSHQASGFTFCSARCNATCQGPTRSPASILAADVRHLLGPGALQDRPRDGGQRVASSWFRACILGFRSGCATLLASTTHVDRWHVTAWLPPWAHAPAQVPPRVAGPCVPACGGAAGAAAACGALERRAGELPRRARRFTPASRARRRHGSVSASSPGWAGA